MSDEMPFQPDTTPSWLYTPQPTEADALKRQDQVAAEQAWLAADPEPDPQTVRVENPDDPAQYVEIERPHEPRDTNYEDLEAIEEIASGLIAFKRFWQWPSGTREELNSAREFAGIIVDGVRKISELMR